MHRKKERAGSLWIPGSFALRQRAARALVFGYPPSGGLGAVAATVPGFFVSPAGLSTNDGSLGSPWSLAYALSGAGGIITPGSTVWLRGGTYGPLNFAASLNGTPTARITFRGFPGEWPRVATLAQSGANTWEGSYQDLRDCEVFYPLWHTRKSVSDESSPPDLPEVTSNLRWLGNNNRCIHCIVHDTGEILADSFGGGNRFYGCVSYNNGWEGGTIRGLGHGFYIQNFSVPRLRKYIEKNISFNNFGNQIQLFTVNSTTYDTSIIDNVFFLGGNVCSIPDKLMLLEVLGGNDTSGLIATNNSCFITPSSADLSGQFFARFSAGNLGDNGIVEDNILMGKIFVGGWGNGALRFNRNAIYGPSGPTIIELQQPPSPYSAYQWDSNQWHAQNTGQTDPFDIVPSPSNLSFAQWQSTTGWDASGSYVQGAAFTGTTVRVVAVNEFEAGRGHIIVYNWDGNATVSIPAAQLSAFLTVGTTYQIREVQALSTPVATVTWDGVSNIMLPMTEVAPPNYIGGNQVNPLPTTGTLFHCFIIRTLTAWEY